MHNIIFDKQPYLLQALNQSQDIVFIADENLCVQYANESFYYNLNYDKHEVIGQKIETFIPKLPFNALEDLLNMQLGWQDILSCVNKSGEKFKVNLKLSSLIDENSTKIIGVTAVATNLSLQLNLEKEIYNAKYKDALTGLGNRRLLLESLHGFYDNIEAGKSVDEEIVFIAINFENLEHIDNLYGYEAGDEVLRTLARRLKAHANEADVIVRITGSRIGILHKILDKETADDAWISKVFDIFASPVRIDEHTTVETPMNSGISFLPREASTASQAVNNIELALSKCEKATNMSHVFYDQELSIDADKKSAIKEHLKQALDNEELTLYYQPKVLLPTHDIYGFEVLLRWKSPKLGFVPPMDFIPVAEQSRFIIGIGSWVLKKACEQLQEWLERGLTYTLSVNISVCQLQDPDFIKTLAKTIKDSNVDATYLELEITESVLMEDISKMKVLFNQIKELGCSISLDDFGIGYSSLSYLKEIPIDFLKIDKSFIQTISHNNKSCSITETILILAQKLSIQVVAEGMEEKAQVNFLEQIKCDKAQGYYFYRPMPIEGIEEVIKPILA